MATDTESMHENMTRLRMRMVQQKLANERERLQRPDSVPSENGYEDQVKLKHAMLKRQELLDRIRNEQLDDKRPRTYTPRRRYTPSPLPPPSRRSLPDFSNKHYHFVNGANRGDTPLELHILPPEAEHASPSIRSSRQRGPPHNVHLYRRMRVPSPVDSVINELSHQPLDPSTYRPVDHHVQDRGSHSYYRLPSRVDHPQQEAYMENYYSGYHPEIAPHNAHYAHHPYYYKRPPEYPSTAPLPRAVLNQPRTPRRRHTADMAQVKHVIEHQFRPAPQQSYQLPPIQTQPIPQITAIQPMTPAPAIMPVQTVQAMPTYNAVPAIKVDEKKGMFNKGDLMEMMMMQNAQMHHMVMQQMMLSNLPGGGGGFRGGVVPYAEPMVPMVRQAPSVYHHHIQNQPNCMPPMDYRRGFGSGPPARTYNSGVFYDDGSNYYTYH